MKFKRFLLSMIIFSGPLVGLAATRVASLQIDNRTKYQTVDGFGGFGQAPTWGVNMTTTEIDKLWGRGAGQMGYTIIRTIIPSDKNSWSGLVSTLKQAQSDGATIFASPWSGPAEYKSTGSLIGGYVLEEHYNDFAKWLNSFVDFMATNGVKIEAVSIQNEPDWNPDYAGTEWSAAQFIKFLTLYGDSIKCKIIAPESLAFRRELSDPILNDSVACSKVDILGGHLYGSMANLDYALARKKNKKIWMTEFLLNDNQSGTNPVNILWSDVFPFAKAINSSMTANMHAWIHYASKRYYGMLGDDQFGTTNGEITKRGYVLSHFAKYVTGKTRIKQILTDPSHSLYTTAYQTANGDSLVLMLINESNDSYTLNLDLPMNVTNYRSILTTISKNMVNSLVTIQETCQPVVTLSASSITTLIFLKSSNREISQSFSADSILYTDTFSDYGGYNYFPNGWQATFDGGTRSPGTYASGSRLFFFRPESVIPAGLYIRSSASNTIGNAIYGMNSGSLLYLNARKYQLTYNAAGWKGFPLLNCSVINKTTYAMVLSKDIQLNKMNSGTQGWSVDLNDVNADTLNFEIKVPGYHLLRWTIPYDAALAVGGYCEAIFGKIKLAPRVIVSLNEQKSDENAGTVKSVQYYNLQGMVVKNVGQGITIIKSTYNDGSTIIRKVYQLN